MMGRVRRQLKIVTYRGYSGKDRIFVKGRLLRAYNHSRRKSGLLENVMSNYRKVETDEVPGREIEIDFDDRHWILETDREGYFTLDTSHTFADAKEWYPITVIVEDEGKKLKSSGQILGMHQAASYGVLSDVDDTLLQTGVNSFLRLKMMYNTFFRGAHQRKPMEGMAKLFQYFSGKPVFYLSNSPWNLYETLEHFFDQYNFPKGPILLRDYGIRPVGNFRDHKVVQIENILQAYEHLPFVMFGDTAHDDADLYIEAATKFPERIKAIYIRQTRNTKNARRIKELIEDQTTVPAVLIERAEEIDLHAKENGFW